MAKFTPSQARRIAEQIKTRFGSRIASVCRGTAIPPSFLAGLISVEAGKDKQGKIREDATRFEPHVFSALKALRDGQRRSYNGIRPSQVKDAPDAALRALATSYGSTQIMGWHCVNNLKCTVGELRDPEKHLRYAVELLKINSRDGDFERGALAGEWREWNSGRETGRTHDPDYVANASAVMNAYESATPDAPGADEGAGSVVTSTLPAPQDEKVGDEKAGEAAPDTPALPGQPVVGGRPEDPPKQASTGSLKAKIIAAAGSVPAVWTAVKGFVDGNTFLVALGIICLTLLALSLIFRTVLMDWLRMTLAASPDKYNVK